MNFGFLNSLVSIILYKTGKTNIVNKVAVNKPPITTVAKGLCTSAPADDEIAIGRNPKAAAAAVNNTGRNLSVVPFRINSSMFFIPSCFNSLKCSINTIPFKTAIPNKAINPTPAEILKGKSRIHKNKTPPTADKGIAEYTIKASLTEPKAKYNKINIKNKAIGTAINKRALAL